MSRINPTGVYNMERAAIPFGLTEQAIAGRAGSIVHDRHSFTDKAIEQCTFSDVGPANKGNDWFGHYVITMKDRKTSRVDLPQKLPWSFNYHLTICPEFFYGFRVGVAGIEITTSTVPGRIDSTTTLSTRTSTTSGS